MNWKRIIGWTAAIILALVVFVFVGGFFLLRNQGFHRYVIAKIVQKAGETTGGRVEIQNFDVHLSALRANAYGLVIHGTEPAGQKPLLQLDKLSVGLKILSVLQHKVNLNELVLEHPVINLVVSSDGKNNIPQSQAPKSNSQTNVFDLAVGHVLLNRGEIYYNDRAHAMDADLHDLRTEINFDFLPKRYRGSMSYHDGRVHYGSMAPLPHALEAQFSATPSQLSLNPAVFTIGGSRLSLQAQVGNYSNPDVNGSYHVLIHTQDFAGLSQTASTAGDLVLAGSIHYAGKDNQPFLKSVSVDGSLNSNALILASTNGRIDLRALRGKYQLKNGDLKARDVAVNLFGGQLAAELDMRNLDSTPASNVRASLRGISIDAARAALNIASLKHLPLTGTIDGTSQAAWTGSVSNVRAQSDLTISAALQQASAAAGPSIPLNGVIHAKYDGRRSTLALNQTAIRTRASSLVANGEVSDKSDLGIQFRSSDIAELSALAFALRPPQPGASKPPRLSGSLAANATVRGSLSKPNIHANVSGQNLAVENSKWTALRVDAQASPSEFRLQNGSLLSATRGQVYFAFTVGLQNWSYLPSNPIAANLSVREMTVAQLQQLAGLHYPVSGDVSADLTLHGSQLNPLGNGSVRLINGKAFNEEIQNLTLQAQGTGDAVNSVLNLKVPGGTAQANIVLHPKTKSYELQLDAPAINLELLEALQAKGVDLTGILKATVRGSGTFANPQLTATIEIPQLQYRQTVITGIKADTNLANQRAELAFVSGIANATVKAHANVNLTGDYYTTGSFDTTTIPAASLLAVYVPTVPTDMQGQMEMHATVKGPLKDTARMEAHVVIPTLSASYQAMQIASARPIRVDYANSVIALQPGEIQGTDTSLRFQGRVPLQNTEPLTFTAQGNVNLRLLRLLSSDLKSSGALLVNLHGGGSTQHPEVQGDIRLQDVALSTLSVPVGLDKVNGTLTLANNRLQITQLTGQMGGGDISATGGIALKPQLQMSIAVNAKSVRLRYPEGLRSVADSDLTFTGNSDAASLDGRVLIDSLGFSKDFDLADFMSQFSGNAPPPAGDTFADKIKLNVALQSTAQLAAVSSELSLEGQANLRVIGTASNPVIVGRAELTSGELFFMKRRYQIERAIINFTDPNRTTPVVNMLITTTINQYNLSLTVIGPVDKLRTSYVSDPPLPPVDIINLIARGQTTEEAAPASMGANSVIANGLASQVSGKVEKLAGLSSLQIDPLLGGNNSNPSARVALQQRVTKNFLFTFSTDITAAEREIVQGEYQINKRWSVSATRDASGGFSVDGKFHSTF
jgi:translocation and assembly module TamB